jgi:hypothetical protein
MKSKLFGVLCGAVLVGLMAAPAMAQQKSAKACRDEWRADKANMQAKKITEKAYVAQCTSGTAAAQPTPTPTPAAPTPKPPPAPATPAAAPQPAPVAPRPAPAPVTAPARAPAVGTPAGFGEYASEAEAQSHCPGDTVVWANLRSKIYHFKTSRDYGNTKAGAYMCEKDTAAAGVRAPKNERHP